MHPPDSAYSLGVVVPRLKVIVSWRAACEHTFACLKNWRVLSKLRQSARYAPATAAPGLTNTEVARSQTILQSDRVWSATTGGVPDFHWGEWISFAGASIYVLWELGRINSALRELADLWNEQYQQRQESADSLQ
ncbi:hypothetical protein FE633_20160 [Streptomyces montanus]|uniref:Transposase n=1 Tax=Streptomyces montanus TaxID=2580423 RepID=A0A5R9FKF6_9ACTN|nr:hypothetical protein [Streptomyces montanus]TLS44352.1 hypothetical protein FE633_20160 [Streptomyces montanus]